MQVHEEARIDPGRRCLLVRQHDRLVHQLMRAAYQPHGKAVLAEPTLGTMRRVLTITGGVDGVPPGTIQALHSGVLAVLFQPDMPGLDQRDRTA